MAKKGLILRALGRSDNEIVKLLKAVIQDIEEDGMHSCGADYYDFELIDTNATSVYDQFSTDDLGAAGERLREIAQSNRLLRAQLGQLISGDMVSIVPTLLGN